MDTFKSGVYFPDTPQNLEDGDSKAHLLDSESSAAQPVPIRPRRSFVKHPWFIFCAVALTWIVYSCTKHALNRPNLVWSWVGGKTGPPPPPGDADHCVTSSNWTTYYDHPSWTIDYPHGAEAFFSLPVDSDALYLVSRGAYQQGLVDIEQSTEASDTVDIRVRVAYFNDKALERATVCQLQRAEGEHGVGIFTPPFRGPHHHENPKGRLQFYVTLTLPAGSLSIKNLETEMPNYSQFVADLQESVLFDKVSLASANGPINVKSIACDVGRFASLNGDIDGHFVASSLDLDTANGGIAPTGADPSRLAIHTANGEIDAEVSLTSEALISGEFEVDAKSNNGAVGLKFTDTPVDSVLRCNAETNVGEVEVELDGAFEGVYSLQTILGSKTVSQRDDVEDPSGKGRHRVVVAEQGNRACQRRDQAPAVAIRILAIVLLLHCHRHKGSPHHISTSRTSRATPSPTAMLPLSLLTAAQNKPMLVELKNGETFNGHLVNCDNFMNITLREVYQTSADGDRFWKLKECYIRGSTIKYLRVPDTLLDAVKEEQSRAREAGRSARGAGPGTRGEQHSFSLSLVSDSVLSSSSF
ncbi:hypothetical protein JVU11DRAFT_7452 [Chiua virens]|nr:hypothetical protein JVU11DRAFT_7452 [Chiua virens]